MTAAFLAFVVSHTMSMLPATASRASVETSITQCSSLFDRYDAKQGSHAVECACDQVLNARGIPDSKDRWQSVQAKECRDSFKR